MDKTLICPHCLANVDNPWPGRQIRTNDISTDVKSDVRGGCIALAVLIGLCVLGVAMASFGPFSVPAAIAALVIIAIIRSLVRWGTSGAPVSTAESVVRILFLVFGTIVAIVIFVYFACAIAVSNTDWPRLGK
jgi:hypothetical protein